MYVEGALDTAEAATGAIITQLREALEQGTTETSGLKTSWKLVSPYCPPSSFKLEQAVDAFCDFLVLNPQKRAKDSAVLLNEALQEAWPCHGDNGHRPAAK